MTGFNFERQKQCLVPELSRPIAEAKANQHKWTERSSSRLSRLSSGSELREVFELADADDNGKISAQETMGWARSRTPGARRPEAFKALTFKILLL